MAIQIDLLPQYVGLRRKVKIAAIFMFFVYVIAGTAFTLTWYSKSLEVQTATTNAAAFKAVSDEADKYAGLAKSKEDSLTPMATTVKFFADATQTGPRRAAVIDMLKLYINGNALVSTIDISDGQTVLVTAGVKNTDDYGNLLLNMRKGSEKAIPPPPTPAIFKDVPMGSGAHGYPKTPLDPGTMTVPAGQLVPQTFPLLVNIKATLRDDLKFDTPVAPGEAAAATTPGQPGAPAAGSGSSSGGPPTT